jgi:hypothetical protein
LGANLPSPLKVGEENWGVFGSAARCQKHPKPLYPRTDIHPLGTVPAAIKQAVDGGIYPETGSTNRFPGEFDSFCQSDTIKYNLTLKQKDLKK